MLSEPEPAPEPTPAAAALACNSNPQSTHLDAHSEFQYHNHNHNHSHNPDQTQTQLQQDQSEQLEYQPANQSREEIQGLQEYPDDDQQQDFQPDTEEGWHSLITASVASHFDKIAQDHRKSQRERLREESDLSSPFDENHQNHHGQVDGHGHGDFFTQPHHHDNPTSNHGPSLSSSDHHQAVLAAQAASASAGLSQMAPRSHQALRTVSDSLSPDEASRALVEHLNTEVEKKKRTGPPNPAHTGFSDEDYNLIVSHLANSRLAWKGLKVCQELNQLEPRHTAMSYLSFIRNQISKSNRLEEDVKAYRIQNGVSISDEKGRSKDPSTPSVPRKRKKRSIEESQNQEHLVQRLVEGHEMLHSDPRAFASASEDHQSAAHAAYQVYEMTNGLGLGADGDGDGEELPNEHYESQSGMDPGLHLQHEDYLDHEFTDENDHHHQLQSDDMGGIVEHQELKDDEQKLEDQKFIRDQAIAALQSGNHAVDFEQQSEEHLETSNHGQVPTTLRHPEFQEGTHHHVHQEEPNPFSTDSISKESFVQVSQHGSGVEQDSPASLSKRRKNDSKPKRSRNVYTAEDQLFVTDHLARTDMSWTGMAVCKAMCHLNPRHSAMSYQTYLRDNLTKKKNLTEAVRLYRIARPDAVAGTAPRIKQGEDPEFDSDLDYSGSGGASSGKDGKIGRVEKKKSHRGRPLKGVTREGESSTLVQVEGKGKGKGKDKGKGKERNDSESLGQTQEGEEAFRTQAAENGEGNSEAQQGEGSEEGYRNERSGEVEMVEEDYTNGSVEESSSMQGQDRGTESDDQIQIVGNGVEICQDESSLGHQAAETNGGLTFESAIVQALALHQAQEKRNAAAAAARGEEAEGVMGDQEPVQVREQEGQVIEQVKENLGNFRTSGVEMHSEESTSQNNNQSQDGDS